MPTAVPPVGEQRALEPLLIAWGGHRDDARPALRDLSSDRYRRWLDDYLDFVRTEGLHVRSPCSPPPRTGSGTAPLCIGRRTRTCAPLEPVLRWADIETIHDLRIAEVAALHASCSCARRSSPGPPRSSPGSPPSRISIGLMNDADLATPGPHVPGRHGSELSSSRPQR